MVSIRKEQPDRAVRMLRKKGVGVMLVSHKISDFDPAMRSAMNISIHFRTKYAGDLDVIGKVLGSEFSKSTPSLPVSYSIFHLADVGDPFVVVWRARCVFLSQKRRTSNLRNLLTQNDYC